MLLKGGCIKFSQTKIFNYKLITNLNFKTMRRSLLFFAAAIGILVLLTSELEYSGGSPGAKTGSPGDGGANCTSCHSGTPNTVEGWIESAIPAEGYVPGETYTITVTGTHAGVSKFGFEATAEDSEGSKTGTIIITNSDETKLSNGNHSVTHKSGGTTPSGDMKTWSFDWTAPESGTGDVSFYAAFNATNGNGSTSGDVVYLSSLTVTEDLGTGLEDESFENSVSVFPVPFKDRIYVKSDIDISEVALYNSAGMLVKTIDASNISNSDFKLNTANLDAGVYIVSVTGENGERFTKQIVKAN